jgi:hypothetical protein
MLCPVGGGSALWSDGLPGPVIKPTPFPASRPTNLAMIGRSNRWIIIGARLSKPFNRILNAFLYGLYGTLWGSMGHYGPGAPVCSRPYGCRSHSRLLQPINPFPGSVTAPYFALGMKRKPKKEKHSRPAIGSAGRRVSAKTQSRVEIDSLAEDIGAQSANSFAQTNSANRRKHSPVWFYQPGADRCRRRSPSRARPP